MQLIISQVGAALSVRGGRYFIRTREQEQYVPVHEVRSICLHPATQLTHEVIMTALDQNTDLLFFDRTGFPAARVWGHQFGSIATIRKNQLSFALSPDGTDWVRTLLHRKADNQQALLSLLALRRQVPVPEAALQTLRHYKNKIRYHQAPDRAELFGSFRGFEGIMSKHYFRALSELLPEAYRFERRSRQPAADAFNALLNYAYGMLYAHIETALIKAGLDPFVGVMHRDEYNRPVLVYDLIEPYRLWADFVVCHLCQQEVVTADFFEVQNGTHYWLDQPGKRILIQSMNDYLHELVVLDGLSRSRLVHLEREAQQLAARLKKYEYSPA
ncbi:hypothetical protein GCM10027275_54440 [Rhabdobacter roseus]|uniref:CRISPR-associated endonuclease Cas1 n=1 Tax=Rhabdobacter roseus TaxID=1655419 RepID=A0A840U562_9BACT|nr:CRISPR-associated endonuclease Cas1 [Rhabdobacter roseus]MBB5287458.1 CRISPR-associated protein Cas1 [Rhabdobacter roseus]